MVWFLVFTVLGFSIAYAIGHAGDDSTPTKIQYQAPDPPDKSAKQKINEAEKAYRDDMRAKDRERGIIQDRWSGEYAPQ